VLLALRAGDDERRGPAIGLGLLAGLLVMVKLNVGVFAGAAVWMALLATTARAPVTTALRLASAAAIVGLPWLLTRKEAGSDWVAFTGAEAASFAALAVVSFAGSGGSRSIRTLVAFAAASVGGIGLGALFPLFRGTSPAAMFECLVLVPQRLAGAFNVPLPARDFVPHALAAMTLAALCAWVGLQRLQRGWPAALVAAAKLGFATRVLMSVNVVWMTSSRLFLGWLSPFLWLVLLPAPRQGLGAPSRTARLVLAWMAALLSLQVYPVAGSQLSFGTFLHVVCGMVVLGDVLVWARAAWPGLAHPALRWIAAALALVLVGRAAANGRHIARWEYDTRVSLDLPGATRLRVLPAERSALHALVTTLRRNADTFVTDPGFNSLYFWTGIAPPTLDVLSHTVALYPKERLAMMVDATLAHRRPYVVRRRFLQQAAMSPYLEDRLVRDFRRRSRMGMFDLLVPRR
jgi:hypothetical protein